ncbi:hypothetical protein CIB84_007312, partial [Bambusicola thoracicus]
VCRTTAPNSHPSTMPVHYVTYKGIKFPPAYNSVHSLSFAHNEFLVRDDDVFNITYPKSGTTGMSKGRQRGWESSPGKSLALYLLLLYLVGTVWMTEILSLIRSHGHPRWNQTVLNSDRMPWFSTRLGLEAALSYPSPRLLTCHLPRHIFPKSFSHSTAKVIYTLRDPRDVVVSYFYFCKMCNSYEDPVSFEQFLRDFLNGELPHGSWFEHVRGWMQMKDRENFFFITYEELKQDLPGSVRRLCHFLGQNLDDNAISSVVQNASFMAMRQNPMCNSVLLPADIMDQTKGQFLRKGV